MQSAPAFRVSGFVVDEDGKPVARAMVMLMGDPRSGIFGPVGSAQTQDDGRFVIADVPSGTYRLSATGALTVNNVRVSGGVERPAEIVVGDADVEGALVVIRRPRQ
jgi:protocatechuate 3,4-dioxygenase beta subunit